MIRKIDLLPRHRKQISAILKEHLPDIEVWAYGSRVNGKSHSASDLDLVLRAPDLNTISSSKLYELKEAFTDSNIPFLVEAKDWALLPKSFHKEIEFNYAVLLKGDKKDKKHIKVHSLSSQQKSFPQYQLFSQQPSSSQKLSFPQQLVLPQSELILHSKLPRKRESSKKISKTELSFAFKQTEIGEMPEEWTVIPFKKCIKKIAINRVKQVQKSQYLKAGKFPIIDQGKLFISGWTNDDSNLFDGELPIIVFGDHTRVFKYINKPFALGADGTKLIKPNNDYNTKYFYYIMKNLSIPNKGYNRHYKILKGVFLPHPPLFEQKKIAGVLSQIQRAIEIQNRLIETTKELKQSTMKQLFTYESKRQKAKKTSLSVSAVKNNQKWPMIKLGDVCIFEYGKPLKKEGRENGKYPVFGSNGIVGYHNKYLIKGPCIIVGRKGTAGEVTYSENNCFPIDTTFYVELKNANEYNLKYLYFIMRTLDLKKISSRSNVPGLNRNDAYKIQVPRPSLHEQKKIAETLTKIDEKIQIYKKKKSISEELFKTTLNKLMTGKIRVHKLNIDVNLMR